MDQQAVPWQDVAGTVEEVLEQHAEAPIFGFRGLGFRVRALGLGVGFRVWA